MSLTADAGNYKSIMPAEFLSGRPKGRITSMSLPCSMVPCDMDRSLEMEPNNYYLGFCSRDKTANICSVASRTERWVFPIGVTLAYLPFLPTCYNLFPPPLLPRILYHHCSFLPSQTRYSLLCCTLAISLSSRSPTHQLGFLPI